MNPKQLQLAVEAYRTVLECQGRISAFRSAADPFLDQRPSIHRERNSLADRPAADDAALSFAF